MVSNQFSPAKKAPEHDFAQMSILTSDWLVACHAAGELVLPEPRHTLHLSASWREERDKVMDEWGDRYFERGTVDDLLASMELVRVEREAYAPKGGLAPPRGVREVLLAAALPDDEVLRLDPPSTGALRHPRQCVLLVPDHYARGVPTTIDPLRGALACKAVQLEMLGALVVHAPTDAVTTVLLPFAGDETARLVAQIREQISRLRADGGLVHNVQFVRPSWAAACCRELAWVVEAEHQLLAP